MRRAALFLAFLPACGVTLDDVPGRACDDAHPCRAGRSCLAGACWAPDELPDGGRGAGGGGGGGTGGGSTGGGAGGGLGQPVWLQRYDGFTGTTIKPNCSLTIDPTRANEVRSAIASANDAEDRATADLTDPTRLPVRLGGRFRGQVTLVAPLALGGLATFAYVGTRAGAPWASLGFDQAGRLVVSSAAGTVAPGAVTQRVSWDGGFRPGTYVVDVAWQQGGTRRVFVNDALLDEVALPAGGAATPADEVHLGIDRYDGDAGTGWSVILINWGLADDQAVTLGGPP